jgi:hypothetical protein
VQQFIKTPAIQRPRRIPLIDQLTNQQARDPPITLLQSPSDWPQKKFEDTFLKILACLESQPIKRDPKYRFFHRYLEKSSMNSVVEVNYCISSILFSIHLLLLAGKGRFFFSQIPDSGQTTRHPSEVSNDGKPRGN